VGGFLMSNLKDVLFLMPKKPDPPYEDGTVLIYYYLTKYLKDMNIIYFENTSKTYTSDPLYPSYEHKHNVLKLKFDKKSKQTFSFLNGYDLDMNYYYDEGCLRQIVEFVKEKEIKIIFCNITLFKYAEELKRLTNCNVILHSIDAKSMVEKSKLRNSNIKEMIKSFLKYRIYKGIEDKFQHFDKVLVVSDLDQQYLINTLSLTENKVLTIANGVDVDFFYPKNTESNKKAFKLGFSGIMDYFPNYEAAMYLLKNIFPELLKTYDDLELYIIGKNPPKDLQEFANQFNGKVKVTGFVKDIREYLAALDLYISPLNSGGGIKNKVLEAMSMGLPIIASETSVSGIEYDDELLVYKSESDMLRKIRELLNDSKVRNDKAKKAREFVVKNYSWETKSAEYFSVIENSLRERKED
jgi:polysaccharide biosynthesis protein PslH